ncbi:MAG TPA: UPF0280 family protein [Dehalococcoidales bacterium]|nr:UPF0280 family protein [Dehalococcoidales bacterium]
MYQPRNYRHWVKDKSLVGFNVVVKETDLYIRASSDLKRKAHRLVLKYRQQLESYIERHPAFLTSLEPLAVGNDAPLIVIEMAEAATRVGVGPMAAVAGAIAEFVGKELLESSPEIIVENGGDIYLQSSTDRLIGIYAGESPLTGKVGLEIRGKDTPVGICTSSGTVGHSLSHGRADAVIALSKSTALADAAATAIGNVIKSANDIPRGIELAISIKRLTGVIIIKDDKIGLWGKVKIRPISERDEEETLTAQGAL